MANATNVAGVVEKLVNAFNAQDIGAVDALIAQSASVLGIGSDPDEWWVGRDHVLAVLETQLKEMEGARWELGESVSSHGWLAAKADVVMADGARVPGRLTVACAPDGSVEHFHYSIGVPNQAAIGRQLTTSPGGSGS